MIVVLARSDNICDIATMNNFPQRNRGIQSLKLTCCSAAGTMLEGSRPTARARRQSRLGLRKPQHVDKSALHHRHARNNDVDAGTEGRLQQTKPHAGPADAYLHEISEEVLTGLRAPRKRQAIPQSSTFPLSIARSSASSSTFFVAKVGSPEQSFECLPFRFRPLLARYVLLCFRRLVCASPGGI